MDDPGPMFNVIGTIFGCKANYLKRKSMNPVID
jgi:hypothetical protein